MGTVLETALGMGLWVTLGTESGLRVSFREGFRFDSRNTAASRIKHPQLCTWLRTNVKPKLTLTYWKEKFSNIADGLVQKIKDGVNAGIGLFNRFIDWLNEKLKLSWGDFSIGGVKIIDKGSFQLLKLPKIPLLAQGAVLPANKPFLAMVGDQKNGTNVEAPLETIKQALAEVMAAYGGVGGDIVIRFEGDLAQLGRVLKPVIDTENKRVGPSLAGGNVR